MKVVKERAVQQKPRRPRAGLSELLLEVSNNIAVAGDLAEAFDVLARYTASVIKAEQASVFLNDSRAGELYTRVTVGKVTREIRMLNHLGVAGHVFTTGQAAIVPDAYADERFNAEIDKKTGYVTKSLLCVPLRTLKGQVIGVAELLNKTEGEFSQEDRDVLEALVRQAAVAL
ncbi:MAG: adenylate/guanylate cyclase domain-containing protein, partial [Acidobacteria bacterium]